MKFADTGVNLIDSLVSGGFPGAQSGTLTMMVAGRFDVMEAVARAMQAMSATIHRVDDVAETG